jgi:NAD(P)-dependent dehydrogenase (short-subunit alcohol dehydrogenase family)
MIDCEDKRLLVVGASVSIGETVALEAAKAGARVAVAARRKDRLDSLVERLGRGSAAIAVDVSDAQACEDMVSEAVVALGGLDWVVYTPALFMLRALDEVTADEWRRVFDIGVIGAALVTRAALPHLAPGVGRVAWFTSDSAASNPHWAGLASYAVSKVALEKLMECWRFERPDVCFTMVSVGSAEGSDGPNAGGWTKEQIERFVPQWSARPRGLQPREVVAENVLAALSSPSYVEHVGVVARRYVAPQEGS